MPVNSNALRSIREEMRIYIESELDHKEYFLDLGRDVEINLLGNPVLNSLRESLNCLKLPLYIMANNHEDVIYPALVSDDEVFWGSKYSLGIGWMGGCYSSIGEIVYKGKPLRCLLIIGADVPSELEDKIEMLEDVLVNRGIKVMPVYDPWAKISVVCREFRQKYDFILYVGHIDDQEGESALRLSDGMLPATSIANYREMIGDPVVFVIDCEDGTLKNSIAHALFPKAMILFGSYFREVPPVVGEVLEILVLLIANGWSSGDSYKHIFEDALQKGVVIIPGGFPWTRVVEPSIPFIFQNGLHEESFGSSCNSIFKEAAQSANNAAVVDVSHFLGPLLEIYDKGLADAVRKKVNVTPTTLTPETLSIKFKPGIDLEQLLLQSQKAVENQSRQVQKEDLFLTVMKSDIAQDILGRIGAEVTMSDSFIVYKFPYNKFVQSLSMDSQWVQEIAIPLYEEGNVHITKTYPVSRTRTSVVSEALAIQSYKRDWEIFPQELPIKLEPQEDFYIGIETIRKLLAEQELKSAVEHSLEVTAKVPEELRKLFSWLVIEEMNLMIEELKENQELIRSKSRNGVKQLLNTITGKQDGVKQLLNTIMGKQAENQKKRQLAMITLATCCEDIDDSDIENILKTLQQRVSDTTGDFADLANACADYIRHRKRMTQKGIVK